MDECIDSQQNITQPERRMNSVFMATWEKSGGLYVKYNKPQKEMSYVLIFVN